MRNYRYVGLFRSRKGHEYQLEVRCNGFIEAFILLTAEAIKLGRHYQLVNITDENMDVRKVDDIYKLNTIIK